MYVRNPTCMLAKVHGRIWVYGGWTFVFVYVGIGIGACVSVGVVVGVNGNIDAFLLDVFQIERQSF